MRDETRTRPKIIKYAGLAFKIYVFYAAMMFTLGLLGGAYITTGVL